MHSLEDTAFANPTERPARWCLPACRTSAHLRKLDSQCRSATLLDLAARSAITLYQPASDSDSMVIMSVPPNRPRTRAGRVAKVDNVHQTRSPVRLATLRPGRYRPGDALLAFLDGL